MTSDPSERIRALYREALERPAGERAQFVTDRAGPDTALRAAVLQSLESLPTESAPASARAALEPGARVGAYRIEAQIGAGGMGEVFRAVDTRLERKVAIKVCAGHFDERFEREARILSQLNHPNICTLFDVGPNFLVMELLEGETLASRIARGALPLDEAARVGAAIAEALAEAHRAGIVHRDLKPQNLMLTRHGVKVLDFGIAKLATDDPLTRTGAIIGTTAYLAPEQLAGEAASTRSDLYALGVVLYEMITGRRPVAGAVTSRTGGPTRAAGNSTAEGRRHTATSRAFDDLVAALLEPDPARRPGSATEVAERLRSMTAPRREAWPRRAAILASAAAVIAALGGVWWTLHARDSAPLEVVRLAQVTTIPGPKRDPAYSPDGKALTFSWDGATGNQSGIYVLRDGQDSPLRLTSVATDISPAWAPDGKRVAVLRLHPGQANELVIVSVPDTATESPVETKVRDVRQPEIITRFRRPVLTWTPDGAAIVVPLPDADSGLTSLYRVSLDGGAPKRVIASRGGQGDSMPAISSDGRWLAYSDFEAFRSQIYIAQLGQDGIAVGEREAVPDSSAARSVIGWSPDASRLLWTQGARLLEWHRGTTAMTAYVAPAAFQGATAHWTSLNVPEVVFANTGVIAELHELQLRDGGHTAAGPSSPVVRLTGPGAGPGLSPDGRWLAFVAPGESGDVQVWLAGAHGEAPHTIAGLLPGVPVTWSPDSRHLAFHSRSTPVAQIFVLDIDDRGRVTGTHQVTHSPFSLFGAMWSADGRFLYSTGNRSPTAQRVMRVSVEGGELEDLFEGSSPLVSRDGKRIFYGKSQSGLFERSLEGDIPSNAERRVLDDYVPPLGFAVSERGIVYVGRDETGRPIALRFFDFELQRSFDLAPPPRTTLTPLTLSADGSRLVYEDNSTVAAELTRMQLRRGR